MPKKNRPPSPEKRTAPKKKRKGSNIRKYRRPLNLNVGVIIFLLIFVYMAIYVYTYLKKDKVKFYEVVEGSIMEDSRHEGMLFREEKVETAEYAGNINYYVREGKRASAGTKVYSVDETGSMERYLQEHPEAGSQFSRESVQDMKQQLSAFSASYSDDDFHLLYDVKTSLDAEVAEHISWNALESLEQMMADEHRNFKQAQTDEAGVVSYVIDGYEDMDPADISGKLFDRTDYKKERTKAGMKIGKGDPVYKLVTSDQWSLVFPLGKEDVERYHDAKSLRVRFPDRELTLSGAFSTIPGADGEMYGKLDFDKYMVLFVADRFVSFEIASDRSQGLKIPTSAVTSKDFFLIPKEYQAQGGDTSDTGFYKEVYTESGTQIQFLPMEIYNEDDVNSYVDAGPDAPLKAGDYVVKPNSGDRYQVGATGSLKGVYNINKGYTVFKQIDILMGNEEYEIVRKNTKYGLSVYDHIVLDADTIAEGENIFRHERQESERNDRTEPETG